MPFFCLMPRRRSSLMPRRRSSASRWLRPPLPPDRRVVKTMPLNVGQGGCRSAVAGHGAAERRQHNRPGDPAVGSDRHRIAGVVIEPGQDLGVSAIGERVVSEADCQHSLGKSAWKRR